MNRILLFLFSCLGFLCFSQQDSIRIEGRFSSDLRTLEVQQEITYHNPFVTEVSVVKLLNWVAAYKNRGTPLLRRKIQDRKRELYFAKKEELGSLQNLEIIIDNQLTGSFNPDDENLYVQLPQVLPENKSVKITLNYTLKLPKDIFTGYGYSDNGARLKYFFIVPDSFETLQQYGKYYRDLEETQNMRTYWDIRLDYPENLNIKSSLPQTQPQQFSGMLNTDPEFCLSTQPLPSMQFQIDNQKINVDFGYILSEKEKANAEFLMPLELYFIKEKLGFLPGHLYLSQRMKKDEKFVGSDDINFWKFHYKLFSDAVQTDLDYIGILSKQVLDQSLAYDKEKDHWLINGVKTYLEIEYLKKFYPQEKLLGKLPEAVRIFGVYPLKIFNASKVKLTDRYGLAYRYITSENSDQKINIEYSKLSNINKIIISHFETGIVLDQLADKMTVPEFDRFLKDYFRKNTDKILNAQEFLDQLILSSNYSAEFLDTFINRKQKVNFKLRSFKKLDENLQIKVSKNTSEQIPFKIETEDKNGQKQDFWFDTNTSLKPVLYIIPDTNAEKIQVNNNYSFPESNYRDNYLYTKGLFANAKRLRFKLIADIPNPEYNELYVSPRLSFNAYDKLQFGINLKNSALFKRKFTFSATPYYSTGTNQVTGSASLGYNFMPADSFFRILSLGVGASYFHYDFDLSYSSFSSSAILQFNKPPRSDISRRIGFAYNHFQRDLSPVMVQNNEYGKYNIWTLNYTYDNPELIHEKNFNVGMQIMEDYQKISAEGTYRYEYAKDRKASLRLFAGVFLKNKTRNSFFDFGVDRVSNYAFSYGFLGQSASSGIFSQQLIIADGGFKSEFNTTVNKWITSANLDVNLWKIFNIYADAGVYKNKGRAAQFIWDSGIKLALIPDFLELYFPVQSSLGFEPGMEHYAKKIRYTLVLNLGTILKHVRRGVY